MSTRALALVMILMVVSLAVGLHLGALAERQRLAVPVGRQAERERGRVAENQPPRLDSVALPTLRCFQDVTFDSKNVPQYARRVRTQEESEAAYHHARAALDAARHYGGNMPHKSAWSLEAVAAYLDYFACR